MIIITVYVISISTGSYSSKIRCTPLRWPGCRPKTVGVVNSTYKNIVELVGSVICVYNS